MSDKELGKTQKALEELVKVEYQAIAAYDEGIAETDDNKLRRQYTRFRNEHEKQARGLNNRLAELGGEPVEYGVGTGKVKAGLFAKITGLFGDAASIGGMVKGAEDGIRIYLDHLDEIHDSKALSIIRRNLESKQQEVRWLEEQSQKASEDKGADLSERAQKAQDTAGEVLKQQAKALKETKSKVEETVKPESKKTGFLGLPVWLLLAAAGAAAFFFLRRQEEPDFSDEAFQYETTDFSVAGENPSGEGYHGISETGDTTQSMGTDGNA
jgi:rubrerythrin